MATTTVRLEDDDERLLAVLAPVYGGRSNVLRHALRSLAAADARHRALADLLADWQDEAGPIDEASVQAMADRYGL